jgi:hypothetical protein
MYRDLQIFPTHHTVNQMVVYIPCFSNPAYQHVGVTYSFQFMGSKQVFKDAGFICFVWFRISEVQLTTYLNVGADLC